MSPGCRRSRRALGAVEIVRLRRSRSWSVSVRSRSWPVSVRSRSWPVSVKDPGVGIESCQVKDPSHRPRRIHQHDRVATLGLSPDTAMDGARIQEGQLSQVQDDGLSRNHDRVDLVLKILNSGSKSSAPRSRRLPAGVDTFPTEDAHLRGGEAGVSLLAETPVVPTPYSGETDGLLQRHGFSAPSGHGERVWQPARRRGWFPVTQRRGHPVGATGDPATVRAWARRWAKERPWGS
jgi:hypothetical protein